MPHLIVEYSGNLPHYPEAEALTALNAVLVGRLCRRLIGGQTGDIAGATQQLDEIAIYLGFALALGIGSP